MNDAVANLIGRAWEASTALEGHNIEPELRERLDEAIKSLRERQPAPGGEDGGWLPLLIVREKPGEEMLCEHPYPERLIGVERAADPRHARRYIPAPEAEGGDDPPYEALREAVSVALAMLEENRQAAAEQVLHKATRRIPAPDSGEGTR